MKAKKSGTGGVTLARGAYEDAMRYLETAVGTLELVSDQSDDVTPGNCALDAAIVMLKKVDEALTRHWGEGDRPAPEQRGAA